MNSLLPDTTQKGVALERVARRFFDEQKMPASSDNEISIDAPAWSEIMKYLPESFKILKHEIGYIHTGP